MGVRVAYILFIFNDREQRIIFSFFLFLIKTNEYIVETDRDLTQTKPNLQHIFKGVQNERLKERKTTRQKAPNRRVDICNIPRRPIICPQFALPASKGGLLPWQYLFVL